jgi:hypothetical protein
MDHKKLINAEQGRLYIHTKIQMEVNVYLTTFNILVCIVLVLLLCTQSN